jgi:outer membrane protein OmpA-like peptidoglycan-associated protein
MIRKVIMLSLALFGACLASTQAQVDLEQRRLKGDGRFTLGTEGRRLMYGYPSPSSTSHFIVRVGKKLFSNTPLSGTVYIKPFMNTYGKGLAPEVTTVYNLGRVRVTQRLTPVDKNMKRIDTAGKLAQYYIVSYEVVNGSRQPLKIGLVKLFDTMIGENDACKIDADSQRIGRVTAFKKGNIPSEMLFYRTAGDTSDHMGACLTKHDSFQFDQPDELYIGNWPHLSEVRWTVLVNTKENYFDSAILLKWRAREIAAGGALHCSVAYGLPAHKAPKLELLLNGGKSRKALQVETESVVSTPVPPVVVPAPIIVQPKPISKTKQIEVFYALGKANLDDSSQAKITALLALPSIDSVLVLGFSDAVGNTTIGNRIGKLRCDVVKNFVDTIRPNLQLKTINRAKKEALITRETKIYGRAIDRKTTIKVFYKALPSTVAKLD